MSRSRLLAIIMIASCGCGRGPEGVRDGSAGVLHGDRADVEGASAAALPASLPAPATIDSPTEPWPAGAGPACARGYVQVSIGIPNSCAVCGDGQIHCWGQGRAAAMTGIGDAVQVASGGTGACALTRAGRVLCWGVNQGNQLGADPGDETPEWLTPKEVILPGPVQSIDFAYLHACALLVDHRVVCWGMNDHNQVTPAIGIVQGPALVEGLAAATITTTGGTSCAIDVNGHAWCWGYNRNGQLGQGDRARRSRRARIKRLDDVIEIDGDGSEVCLRRGDDAVWCWGERGAAAAAPSGSPPRPRLRARVPSARHVAVGDAGILVIDADGRVLQLTGNRPEPIDGLGPVRALDASDDVEGACAILADGSLVCWGDNTHGNLVIALPTR